MKKQLPDKNVVRTLQWKTLLCLKSVEKWLPVGWQPAPLPGGTVCVFSLPLFDKLVVVTWKSWE